MQRRTGVSTGKSKRGAALARDLVRGSALAAAVLIVAGCPAPIPRTEITSVPVVGTIRWADGTPLAGADVVVSTVWDKACGDAAAHGRTDDAGAFALPGTQKHYTVTWIFPGDLAAPRYRVCAAVRDTLRLAYTGNVTYDRAAKPDSLDCVAWELDAKLRLSCAGRGGERGLIAGGRWLDDSTGHEGTYRVFLTEEPTHVKGYKKNARVDRPYVYVQWLRPREDSSRYEVVATTSLPIDRDKVWSLREPQLWQHGGHWVVSLKGFKHGFMDDMATTELVFQLGAPGRAALIAGP